MLEPPTRTARGRVLGQGRHTEGTPGNSVLPYNDLSGRSGLAIHVALAVPGWP